MVNVKVNGQSDVGLTLDSEAFNDLAQRVNFPADASVQVALDKGSDQNGIQYDTVGSEFVLRIGVHVRETYSNKSLQRINRSLVQMVLTMAPALANSGGADFMAAAMLRQIPQETQEVAYEAAREYVVRMGNFLLIPTLDESALTELLSSAENDTKPESGDAE